MKKYNIAVIGASENVGQNVLGILDERNFPIHQLEALTLGKSKGLQVSFGDKTTLILKDLENFDFAKTDIAFFCAESGVSKQYAQKAVQQGATVIDKTSHFRMNPNVPLIVPEINANNISISKAQLITSPSCVAIPLALALYPLHKIATLKRVVISTYQSVSDAGRPGMDELYNQTRNIFVNEKAPVEVFPKPIAFNIIPHIDNFEANGFTSEEIKIAQEIQKIIDPSIKVVATCVRVPVFIGHSIAVTCEFEHPLTLSQARKEFTKMPGLQVQYSTKNDYYNTPIEIAGEDNVVISRIRSDPTVVNGLCLWITCDNLRKGAALNAVQIAEYLIRKQN